MATTTPNFGWPVPTSTDLVKDGAVAIEALGDAIDATVFGLGSSGFTLVNNTDFTAQTSVNLSNILTATYSRYRVLVSAVTSGAGATVNLQFRENTTNKATNYYQGYGQVNDNGTGSSTGVNNGTQLVIMTSTNTTSPSVVSLDLYRSATNGVINGNGYSHQNGNANFMGGRNDGMTNFTGISINTSAGNMTGNIKIYGYQES
jgi:hypothetical protein